MASPARTAAQARERRARIAAVALGAVLVVVVAVQVPRVLDQARGDGADAAPAAPAPTAPKAPAATPKHPARPAASLARFPIKDPFRAHVLASSPARAPSAKPPAPPAKPAEPAKPAAPEKPEEKQPPAPEERVVTFTARPAPNAAVIVTNGERELVRVGASFPSDDPVFRLVGIGDGLVRVAPADGSFTTGARSVAVRRDGKLTLASADDESRYVVELVRLEYAKPPAGAAKG